MASKFKLDFDFPPLESTLSIDSKILLLGSCFSESIGQLLTQFKFDTNINPLGTLYNPISIFQEINLGLKGSSDFSPVEREGVWYEWNSHSKISSLSKSETKSIFESSVSELGETLKKVDWIIVTPGSAFVYELVETHRIVANCHGLSQSNFNKRLLSVGEIIEAFKQTQKIVSAINPDVNWLFTVSPVRHLRDGLVNNNISKAVLLQSINGIISENANSHYFPSYEIIMDELRDYRFFKEDLLHPNTIAIKYVWERLVLKAMTSTTQNFIEDWSKILQSMNHKPFSPSSQNHMKFIKKTITEVQKFSKLVDVTSELDTLKKQLL